MEYKISVVLDKRRKLDNGKFPVKVRVWHYGQKKAHRYKTKYSMFQKDFKESWASSKTFDNLKPKQKTYYKIIQALYDRAEEEAATMDYFDFKEFGKRLNRESSDKTSVVYHFKVKIDDLKDNDRIGTASSYNCALVSILKYQQHNSKTDVLHFMEITPKWLMDYERFMMSVNGSSITTVSIYTRSLRVIFNLAIGAKDLDSKYYPFGRGKYVIPSAKKVKKTLTRDQTRTFYNAKLPPLQERARDYWFFSYFCKGMNFRDIALLKYENLKDGKISYLREKTRFSKREKITEISVRLNEVSQSILDRYKTDYSGEQAYVFPILSEKDSPQRIFEKVRNFIRATNQQLKQIAKAHHFSDGLSTYWARHGYTTNMVNMGATMERIKEDLNHVDITTTQRYFDGFEDSTKDELMEKLIQNLG